MYLLFGLVLIYSIAVYGEQRANLNTLKFVHALWRHGDRTPAGADNGIPNDVNNTAGSWKEGLGQLTKKGMLNHFNLGQYLRTRYHGFLNESYNSSEIYVRSTCYNRTLMSAMSNMAGFFYPPIEQNKFLSNLSWYPVPVHSLSADEDAMLLGPPQECPNAEKARQSVTTSTKAVAFEAKYSSFVDELKELSGNPNLTVFNLSPIYDPLWCEYNHNDAHPFPNWVSTELFDKIVKVFDESCQFYIGNLEWQRTRGGLLLGDILSRMQNKTKNLLDQRLKYYVYSAHDTTLISYLQNIGAMNPSNPPYASVILTELHLRNGTWFVEIYFRNDTNKEPYLLNIENCQNPCTLEQFGIRSKKQIPSSWQEACGVVVDPEYQNTFNYHSLALGLGITNIILLSILTGIAFMYFTTLREERSNSYVGLVN